MTAVAIEALAADREGLLDLLDELAPGAWSAPSGCDGWRVQDVVAHLGALFWMSVAAKALPDPAASGVVDTEAVADFFATDRRDWSPERVLADYRDVSGRALEVLPGLVGQDFEISLGGNGGAYPADLIINAYAFDHFTHIRADLFTPRGPFGAAIPAVPLPVDDTITTASLEWIEAALPQQNPPLSGRLTLQVEDRILAVGPDTGRTAQVSAPAVLSLVRALTQRGDWNGLGLVGTGDADLLDEAKRLRVF